MRLTEISGVIEEGMWNYGDVLSGKVREILAGPKVRKMASVEKDGFSAHRIDISILTATYLETPAHLISGSYTVDEVPLDDLFLEATILKITKGPREHIELENLEEKKREIKEASALIIFTGWFERWNKENFVLDSPHFSPEAMDYIVEKKIKILAGDLPCYDDPRDPEDSKNLPQLNKLYQHDILALAPIVNGDEVEEGHARLVVLPMKVKGLCATPARAVIIKFER